MRVVFSPPPHVAKADEDPVLEEYADALRAFDMRDLRDGWRRIRESHAKAFWPAPGQLVKACADARRNRFAALPRQEQFHGRFVDGALQPWGGACRCRRCIGKIPTEGFFRASADDYREAAALATELDVWSRAHYAATASR